MYMYAIGALEQQTLLPYLDGSNVQWCLPSNVSPEGLRMCCCGSGRHRVLTLQHITTTRKQALCEETHSGSACTCTTV